ncbi:hypothetical protein ACEZCY_14595 [Streptacidiphilus sp. N1-12]|uniref:Uncharacterized protein n=2 Tax=Streptacidiphilus alkalitolerans TaxID=3342712 RepID=A0ABV6WEJ0_9ACTN
MSDVDESAWLRAALREELACLWSDLDQAIRYARNGVWSIACAGVQARITAITQLVGPTPWDEIQFNLLEDGTYQRLHTEMGVDAPVDMAEVARARAESNAWRTEQRARISEALADRDARLGG